MAGRDIPVPKSFGGCFQSEGQPFFTQSKSFLGLFFLRKVANDAGKKTGCFISVLRRQCNFTHGEMNWERCAIFAQRSDLLTDTDLSLLHF